MPNIQFQIVQWEGKDSIELIANWYLLEWDIPKEKTIQRLSSIRDNSQFQVLMKLEDIPVATAGLYNHAKLPDKKPRFKVYKNWLTLVYTVPEKRHQGYGAFLCTHIQYHSKK